MSSVPQAVRLKLSFLIAGFASSVFSVWLYLVQDLATAGVVVGLSATSIYSLGTFLLATSDGSARHRLQAVRR